MKLDRWGSNIASLSYSWGTPSRNLSDSSGEVGQVSATVRGTLAQVAAADTLTFSESTAELINSKYSLTGGMLSITADSLLQPLVTERVVRPMEGTAQEYMDSICALVDLPAGTIQVPGDETRVWPGYAGDLWTHVKQLLAYCKVSLSGFSGQTLSDAPVFDGLYSDVSEKVEYSTQAERLRMYYYVPLAYDELYPSVVAVDEQDVIQVESGEVTTASITLDAWVASVDQPVAKDLVLAGVATSPGYFSVAGSDGLPVRASQWNATNGLVRVDLNEDDPTVVDVTVIGPDQVNLTGVDDTVKYSPYSIAATTTEGGLYNSLHITGTGYPYRKAYVDVYTGAAGGTGITEVDIPFIRNPAEAYDIGFWIARATVGVTHSLTGTTTGDIHPGMRLKHGRSWFRVMSVNIGKDVTSFEAVDDTLFSEFDSSWSGLTLGDYQTARAGDTFRAAHVQPLREVS